MTDPTPNDGLPPTEGHTPEPPVNPYETPQQAQQPDAAPPTEPYGQQQQPYGQQQPQYGQQPQQPQQPQQYGGQQPNQYGGTPGGPGHPGGPAGPGGPVPPKKGLPGWAWALIIAGGVLLLGAIAAVVVVFSLVSNAVKEEDCSAPGSCGQGLPPTATEEAPVETETAPDDSIPTSGTISIDSSADLGGPPVWGVPLPDAWEITVFDQEGINQLDNSALRCTLVTSQNVQDIDTSSSSDWTETQNLMQLLRDLLAGDATEVEVTSESFVDLSLQAADSGSYLEFGMDRVDYTAPNNERFASVFFGRSMPHSGSYMWAQVDCPSAVFDGADSPLQEIIDQITVVPAF